jgi:metallo-beta-lactamase class B
MRPRLLLFLIFITLVSTTSAQLSETEQAWNRPVEPFRIAGNVYYVGAADLTSYLITTPKGHILLDSGMLKTVPLVRANIEKLGFKLADVKALVNSHAHYDHAGGLAELKRLTKATLYASEADAKLLARGGKGDPNYGDRFEFEAVSTDQTFNDGWKLKLGGTTLTAMVTPGHTQGCTSWTMDVTEAGRRVKAIFVCSVTAPGYTLVGNKEHPEIVSDYESTFRRLKALKVDLFLSSHASAFEMAEKLELRKANPSVNPFIDPKGYSEMLERTEGAFRKLLASQTK